MALVQCPDCGKDVSDRADFCPHCGCPGRYFAKPTIGNTYVGGSVMLGRWGDEDIAWRVLVKEGRRALLVAEQGVDCKPFNQNLDEGNEWGTSSLKRWLEDEFGSEVGLPSEPFCLSADEVEKYFTDDDDRICYPTNLAKSNGVWTNDSGACGWWLRSAGSGGRASVVRAHGYVVTTGDFVDSDNYAVRPAVWINL